MAMDGPVGFGLAITLRDLDFQCAKPDQRHAVVFDEVRGLRWNGLSAQSRAGVFLSLVDGCDSVSVISNDLSAAVTPFERAPGISGDVIYESANRLA